jgi:hypothetical protein
VGHDCKVQLSMHTSIHSWDQLPQNWKFMRSTNWTDIDWTQQNSGSRLSVVSPAIQIGDDLDSSRNPSAISNLIPWSAKKYLVNWFLFKSHIAALSFHHAQPTLLVLRVETPTTRRTWTFVQKLHVAGIEKNTYVPRPPSVMLPTLIPIFACKPKFAAEIAKK